MSHLNIPDPRDLTWNRWSSELALQDPVIPSNFDEANWRRFGAELLFVTDLQDLNVPQPYTFKNWRDWAQRLRDATLSLS